MLIIQGNVISLEMKGDQFYFRNILSALSLEGYIVIRGRRGTMELSFFCFSFIATKLSFPASTTSSIRSLFVPFSFSAKNGFAVDPIEKKVERKKIINVYTFHLWFISNPKIYFFQELIGLWRFLIRVSSINNPELFEQWNINVYNSIIKFWWSIYPFIVLIFFLLYIYIKIWLFKNQS